MDRLKLLSVVLLFLSFNFCAFSQNYCLTNSNIPDFLQTIPQNEYRPAKSNDTYVIRIFFHIIKRSNGTGGQTLSNVNIAFNILQADYKPHGICFDLLGVDEIWSDNCYDNLIYLNCDFNGNTDCDRDGNFCKDSLYISYIDVSPNYTVFLNYKCKKQK